MKIKSLKKEKSRTIEDYPDWTRKCIKLRKIGSHQFYKDPNYEK